jgi:hypothetical protein
MTTLPVKLSRLTESHQDVGFVGFLLFLRRRRAWEGQRHGHDQVIQTGHPPSFRQTFQKLYQMLEIAINCSSISGLLLIGNLLVASMLNGNGSPAPISGWQIFQMESMTEYVFG